ncbi:MAG: diphosphate--fructose-6-phosphate 1-phosphotransferase [Lachnospiraceae bacterium]
MLGNVIVGQSGGPTAVINASVAGVYTAAKEAGVNKVYGMVYGIQGFLEDKILDLDEYLSTEEGIELLKRTPSAFLGSCRFKLPEGMGQEAVYEKVFSMMDKYDISCMFYVGGNDSMDTVKKLSDYAESHGKDKRFIGIPKTIDNDLPFTDHCPGYGSAAKYIATSLKEIIRDNAVYGDYRTAILLVEIMGRHAGWLTAAAALAKDATCEGVDAIYLPERDFDMDAFLKKVWELAQKKNSIVIAVSEGIHLANGRFVCELDGGGTEKTDVFGHKQLSGCGVYLAELIREKLGYKARAVEFSTLQRAASHIASLTDIEEAFAAGKAAVEAAHKGNTGCMVILEREPGEEYWCRMGLHDIHAIANVERKVPLKWISEDGCGISEEYEAYARPLIQGELFPIYENGTPKHLVRNYEISRKNT